jgi:hypothetical protein
MAIAAGTYCEAEMTVDDIELARMSRSQFPDQGGVRR